MSRGKTKRRSRVKTQLRLQIVFDQIDTRVKPPARQVRPRLDYIVPTLAPARDLLSKSCRCVLREEREDRVRRTSRHHVPRTGYVRSSLAQGNSIVL